MILFLSFFSKQKIKNYQHCLLAGKANIDDLLFEMMIILILAH